MHSELPSISGIFCQSPIFEGNTFLPCSDRRIEPVLKLADCQIYLNILQLPPLDYTRRRHFLLQFLFLKAHKNKKVINSDNLFVY